MTIDTVDPNEIIYGIPLMFTCLKYIEEEPDGLTVNDLCQIFDNKYFNNCMDDHQKKNLHHRINAVCRKMRKTGIIGYTKELTSKKVFQHKYFKA